MNKFFLSTLSKGVTTPEGTETIPFSGTTFSSFPVAAIPNDNIISNGNYLAFGTAILNPLNSNQILYFIREGIDAINPHANNGKIVMFTFNLLTNKRSGLKILYEAVDIDMRDAECIVIGTEIFLWLNIRSQTQGKALLLSYIKSTDGGVTWGSKVDVLGEYNSWTTTGNPVNFPNNWNVLAFGKGFYSPTEDAYFQSYYMVGFSNAATEPRRTMLLRTDDLGATWSDIEATSDLTQEYNECAWAEVGTNQILGISRRKIPGLYQIQSADGASTFSELGNTGLSPTGVAMADVHFLTPDIHLFWQQRGTGTGYINYSKELTANIWSNHTNWGSTLIFDNTDALAPNGLGYPTGVYLGSGKWFLGFSHETFTTQKEADLYFIFIDTTAI